MKFHNFISNRKTLICLISAFAMVLFALLGIWIGLSRTAGVPSSDPTQATALPTDSREQIQGQPTPTDVPENPSAPPSGDTPTDPSGISPTQPGGTSASPGGTTNSGSSQPSKSDGDQQPEQTPPKPDEPQLTYDQFSLYSGQYVEDGRDELVTNVAAILVTNRSGKFLDLATLTFEIDGREASFRVSGLPAGRSAWVLEASRMTATQSSTFTFVDMVTGFRENVISSTDKLSITCIGNLVTATNQTDNKLEDVYVYYRVLHTDGNYLGGITYVIDFGTLEPGQSVEKLAGHFSAEQARIVRIGWTGQ